MRENHSRFRIARDCLKDCQPHFRDPKILPAEHIARQELLALCRQIVKEHGEKDEEEQ